jgi:uncharacterized membrane protein
MICVAAMDAAPAPTPVTPTPVTPTPVTPAAPSVEGGPRAAPPRPRLAAIDALRGLVMVLMTLDHASGAFNAGRLVADSPFSYTPGTALDPAQFFTRWVTHLCAPTFVFLAGLSLSISVARRRARGEPPGGQDRFLVTRGLFIAACDPLWMSWAFGMEGRVIFQVLYAIGMSFVAMAALRRLPRAALGALALATLLGHEVLAGLAMKLSGGHPGAAAVLLLTGGPLGKILVGYPLLPWLAIMALGYAAGGVVSSTPAERLSRRALGAGLLALAVFALVRGLDGYGNLRLYRDDGSLVQWLHVCKYPPSLSYTALELGLMGLWLSLFLRVPALCRGPLPLLGQTAFFFYLLHVHLLEGAAHALGLFHREGIGGTVLATALALAVLTPLCALYRRYKAAHPDGWARYV